MTNKTTLKVCRLSLAALLPTRGTPGAACLDVYAAEGNALPQGGSVVIPTHLAFEVPENHVMLVFSRSGMGFNQDIRLANCVGVIDSDYRGELRIKLSSDRAILTEEHDDYYEKMQNIRKGDRIAQVMVLPIPELELQEVSGVDEFSTTERGAGGYGSTGA